MSSKGAMKMEGGSQQHCVQKGRKEWEEKRREKKGEESWEEEKKGRNGKEEGWQDENQ